MVDISQQESILSLTENAVIRYTLENDLAAPMGNDHPFVRPYGQYPCKDGYVFFGGYTDKFWAITCEMFGEPGIASDPAIDTMEKRFDKDTYETRVRPIIETWFSRHTKAELEEMAGDRIPLSAIKTIGEVVEDPHIAERKMIIDVPVDSDMVRMFGNPVHLSAYTSDTAAPAPLVGADNEEVYAALAGVDAGEIAKLKSKGVI